jgi:hypothetical protein
MEACSNSDQTLSIIWIASSRVEISPQLSLLLIAPRRHSIGLRSGELGGHCGKSYRLQKECPESMHSCDSLHHHEQKAAGIRRIFCRPFLKSCSIPEHHLRHLNWLFLQKLKCGIENESQAPHINESRSADSY